MTPLFVAGMGRSGTTNALRVANTHPNVMLNGEIALPVLRQYFTLLEAVEKCYSKNDAMRDGWFERKADYMFSSFGYLAKGGRGHLHKRGVASFMGHKSPPLETMFDSYESHFASAGLKPISFYCARNAFDCWRSYRSMPWNSYDRVDGFLQHYAASFETLARMQKAAPDRVFVLNLDALAASGDPLGFYRDKLFAPLGLEISERAERKLAKFTTLRHAASHEALGDEDRGAIARHPGMRALYSEMFAPYLKTAHL